MQLRVEDISSIEKCLHITVPAEQVANETNARLQKLHKQSNIKGFRPGKAPMAMVQKLYGQAIQEEVLEEVIRKTYVEALSTNKLSPVGLPKIELVSAEPQADLSYKAVIEIYPVIKLADFGTFTVEKHTAAITEKDIDAAIEKLRKQHVTWVESTVADKSVQIGDQVLVDFTITVRGDLAAKPRLERDVKFVLGAGEMWPEFEQHIYSARSGEELNFTLTFPDTHADKALASKEVDFVVTMRQIFEPVLPELDAEFMRKLGVEDGDINGLRLNVNKKMEQALKQALKQQVREQIIKQVMAANPIEVPQAIILSDRNELEQDWRRRYKLDGKNSKFPVPEAIQQQLTDAAKERVTLGLLFAEAVNEFDIKITDDEIRAKIADMVAAYGDVNISVAEISDWYYAKPERIAEIKAALLEERVLAAIENKAKVAEKVVSYNEALGMKVDGKAVGDTK